MSGRSIDSRPYRQVRRAAKAATTRRRIIDATRRLVESAPAATLTVEGVAAAAGIARSTVYTSVGSKSGLVQALADDLLAAGGFAELPQALADPDPVAALDRTFRIGLGVWRDNQVVISRLLALAATDAEVHGVVARLDEGRRVALDGLVTRLVDAGRLRGGVSPAGAADAIWLLSSFAAFDELVRGRGLDGAAATDRLRQLVLALTVGTTETGWPA